MEKTIIANVIVEKQCNTKKDPIKLDRNNKPKRTWILEGVSRDWKIDISLDAPDDEIDSLKESK